jgi:hypothetical protein
MIAFLIKISPTLWPFLKELLVGNKSPRGGVASTPLFRIGVITFIVLVVFGGVVYDTVKTLYLSNREYMLNNGALQQSELTYKRQSEQLYLENKELRQNNINLERDVSSTNAKLAYANEDRERMTATIKELREALDKAKGTNK